MITAFEQATGHSLAHSAPPIPLAEFTVAPAPSGRVLGEDHPLLVARGR